MIEIARVLEPLLAEAEKSFATTPKALWSARSYLAPKDVAAIRAALLQALQSSRGREVEGWQPIETAPRDGTHIILAFGQDGVMEGWWEDADPGLYPWKFLDLGCSGSPFSRGELINGSREVRGGPTHWMPLPSAPLPRQDGDHPKEIET